MSAVGDVRELPRARWGGQERRTVSGWEALARMAVAAGVMAAPLAAVVALITMASGRRWARRTRWQLAGGGVLATVVVALLGGWSAYVAPYREVVAGLEASDAVSLLKAGPEGVLSPLLDRFPYWLLGQLPLSAAAGAAAGALWLEWRHRTRAWWRETPEELPAEQVDEALTVLGADEREPAQELAQLVVRLGVDTYSGARCEVPGRALRQHLLVAGATGYGKSRTIEQLLHELIDSDHAAPLNIPVVLIDMKADPELAEALAAMAAAAGRRFRLVTVTGRGGTYNPIRFGSVEQVCSRIVETLDQVAGGGFSEPHHREAAEVFLRYAMVALDDLVDQRAVEQFPDGTRPWRRDLPDLAKLMSVKALAKRGGRLRGTLGRDLHHYLEYLQGDGRELLRSVPGLAARILNMTAGDAGRILTDHPSGLDLYNAIHGGDVVLFSLSAARDARAARQIGSLALTDLGSVGDRLLDERFGSRGGFFLAGVDEFSALGGSTMTSLFQRIRGAGGGLLLATQDLADLDAVSREFAAAVLTNTNTMILHRQRYAAEALAAMLGTRPGWEELLQVQDDAGPLGSTAGATGSSQLRPVDERLVEPETLRRLAPGHAVVAIGHPLDTTQTVRIALADRPTPAPSNPPVRDDQRPVHLTKTPPPPRSESAAPAVLAPQPPPPEPVPAADPMPPEEEQNTKDNQGQPEPPTVDGADMWH